jgi:hypothetical protein
MQPMTSLILYRGIAVGAATAAVVTDSIRTHGLAGTEGHWTIPLPDICAVRKRLEADFLNPQIRRSQIYQTTPFKGACACGTQDGAVYYAIEHNRSTGTVPLVVKFTASLSDVCVDGRDFLYTAFQLWDRHGRGGLERQVKVIEQLFGEAALRYFEAATTTHDQQRRVALCSLACFDARVVLAHYENRRIIGGRHKTRFASAFEVRCPIGADRIVEVCAPKRPAPSGVSVTVGQFIDLGLPPSNVNAA